MFLIEITDVLLLIIKSIYFRIYRVMLENKEKIRSKTFWKR